MLALLAFKLIATVFSYSSGGAGGIFAPSLFLGAMLGSAFGHLDQIIFERMSEGNGAFALVGMGAMFAAIVRAPITSVLIIFEMTDGYGLILPLMIANMTAYRIARIKRPLGIYDALLKQDGIELPKRTQNPLAGVPVEAVMTTKFVSIDPSTPAAEAIVELESHEYSTFPVLARDRRFIGFVNRYVLERAVESGEGSRPVSEFAVESEPVHPETPVPRAALRLHEIRSHLLAVVESGENGRFVGLLTSSDVVRAHASLARPDASEGGRSGR